MTTMNFHNTNECVICGNHCPQHEMYVSSYCSKKCQAEAYRQLEEDMEDDMTDEEALEEMFLCLEEEDELEMLRLEKEEAEYWKNRQRVDTEDAIRANSQLQKELDEFMW